MKLYITDIGDTSVGVFPTTYTIETPFDSDDYDDSDKEFFLQEMLKIYNEFSFGYLTAEYGE